MERDGIYVAYANGIVRDTKTGLEWTTGPNRDTRWDQARSWVQSLSLDGGGWRIPTLDELEGLYQKGMGVRNMTPSLKTSGHWVWSGGTESISDAWYFDFNSGHRNRYCYDQAYSYNLRAFAVRSRSDG